MPFLLLNSSASGASAAQVWGGGAGIFEVAATAFGGATVTLQALNLDGTFSDVAGTAVTANGKMPFSLPPCQIRVNVSAAPTGLSVSAWRNRKREVAVASAPAAPVVPAGSLKTLTIADDTQLDPVVTTAGPNIGSAVGATGSGWVALITLKGITTTGACDPTKLTITVSDPGFDTAGNATTVSRTITGVAQIRRQYPNGGSKLFGTDGAGDTIFYVSLDDTIFAGTTIVSATLASGFYSGQVAGNTGATFTNLSTRAYPKPIWGWINPQNDYTTATSYAVEGLAFSMFARAGQQVACVKYSATDGTNTSATVTVSTPTLSTKITKGNIPEVWAASVDFSGLNNSTSSSLTKVNAKVYPWIGDSSAVLDLVAGGIAWPTNLPCTALNVFNDRLTTYGGAYAYVQAGAGGTPQVSTNATTARANPYATIAAALTAIATWNNANRSHNNFDGATIRLMDASGSPQTHTVGTSSSAVTGSVTYCTIEADPLNAAAVSITYSAFSQYSGSFRWRNLSLVATAGQNNCFAGRNENPNTAGAQSIILDTVTLDGTALTGNFSAGYNWLRKFAYNVTIQGGKTTLLSGGTVVAGADCCIYAGVITADTANIDSVHDQPKITVGCILPKWYRRTDPNASGAGDNGAIMFCNRVSALESMVYTTAQTYDRGFANVQNLYENDNSNGTHAMSIFNDGDLTTIQQYLDMHNTAVGNRCNRMYNDATTSKFAPYGVIKRGRSMFSVVDDWNIKTDTFTSGQGSTGNWEFTYGTGNIGNVSLFGAVNRTTADWPHNDNTDQPYLGNAWLPSSTANLTYTGGAALTQAQVGAIFNSYTVLPINGTPANGGDYHINTGNANAGLLRNRVPSGRAVLKYALDGVARKNDGTGAAGCYEA